MQNRLGPPVTVNASHGQVSAKDLPPSVISMQADLE